MHSFDILFACGIVSGVASLLDIIVIVTKACRQVKKYYYVKNTRPVDETEQAE